MKIAVLVHGQGDDVGVAVVDLKAGDEVEIKTLEGQSAGAIQVREDIPLGHKISLRALSEGQDVIKFGCSIGKATQSIMRGSHVHVHNLKTNRWTL